MAESRRGIVRCTRTHRLRRAPTRRAADSSLGRADQQRAGFQSTLAAGASAVEIGPNTAAGVEIAALWRAVGRSIEAINAAQLTPGAPANGDEALIGTQAA